MSAAPAHPYLLVRASLAALGLLSACAGGGERIPRVTPAVRFDDLDVVSYEILSGATGAAPLAVPVRAVNQFAVSVPTSEATSVDVNGAPVEVSFDGFGYGHATIATPGWAQVGTDGAAFAFAEDFDGFALDPVWQVGVTSASAGVALPTGALAAEGDRVWWAGRGAPSHVVLLAGASIVGLEREEIDVDGYSDAIAWTTDTVFVLRGRGEGGMSWGAGFRAAGYTVGGVGVGDLSGDNLADIAIAWVDAVGSGLLDVWEGDSQFGFVAAEPNDLYGHPVSLAVGDQLGDDVEQVTVLFDDGAWARYEWGAEQRYIPIGPDVPVTDDFDPPTDATLLPMGDVNADAADELIVAGPRFPDLGRDFWVLDLSIESGACRSGREGAQCEVDADAFPGEVGAWLTTGDADTDLLDEVVYLGANRVVSARTFNIDAGVFDGAWERYDLFTAHEYGPIGTTDLDGDPWMDIVTIGPLVREWRGRGWADERFWTILEPDLQFVRELSAGPIVPLELDGNLANLEVVLFELIEGQRYLSVVQYERNQGRGVRIGNVVLDGGGAPVDDVAWCENTLYVALNGVVHRIGLNPLAPVIAASNDLGARRIACGPTPLGGDVAVLEDGRIRYIVRTTMNAAGPAILADGAVDLAIGDFGDGPVAETCDTPGCEIAFVPLTGGGLFAVSGEGTTSFADVVGATWFTEGGGALSLADADGDGNDDLLGLDGERGLLAVWRSTGDQLAPPQLLRIPEGWQGAARIADGDGDGTPDLWVVDEDDDVNYVRSGPLPAVSSVTR